MSKPVSKSYKTLLKNLKEDLKKTKTKTDTSIFLEGKHRHYRNVYSSSITLETLCLNQKSRSFMGCNRLNLDWKE